MNIKNPKVIIDKTNPFKFCKLRREVYAKVLTEIVSIYSDGFVLALNNSWGTGKTTFIKMWQQYLVNNNFQTLYFNAWENDFETDVLVALISELEEIKNDKTEKLFTTVLQKAAPLAKSIAQGVIKTQVEKFVGKDLTKVLLNETSIELTNGLQNQINAYTTRKKSILEFKESLKKFIVNDSVKNPVIFFIDELDRCKPSYAVEVLEQIKHLFSVSGITFVLSIDKKQLQNAICGYYGSDNLDSEEYLKRFIDLEYSIPEPPIDLYCEYLYDYYRFDDFLNSEKRLKSRVHQGDKSDFLKYSVILFEKGKLTLRQQENVFAYARTVMLSFQVNNYIIPGVYLFLIYAKLLFEDLYQLIKTGIASPQELIDIIETILPKNINRDDLRYIINIEAILLILNNNSLEQHQRYDLFNKTDKENNIKLIVNSNIDASPDNNSLLELIQYHQRNFDGISRVPLKHLVNKIELIENLNIV